MELILGAQCIAPLSRKIDLIWRISGSFFVAVAGLEVTGLGAEVPLLCLV